ncbi:MAG: hypothetical protein NTY75_02755 [Candidatus Shapirobacteria bacterium]|nr:hypothetical protein [Candidatus Shapirobacteria bacterium]
MATNRTDLDRPTSTTTYVLLTVILVILSFAGVYLLLQLKKPIPAPVVEDTIPTITTKPTAEPTTKSARLTITPVLSPTPTPTYLNYQSQTDGFSVVYSSARKLYQDTESFGNRYTFYLSSGNISVHVGTIWSWVHPGRDLTSGKFVYEIATQKIVDFESAGKKYTIQCVHNGKPTLIEECDQFLKDFKIQSL